MIIYHATARGPEDGNSGPLPPTLPGRVGSAIMRLQVRRVDRHGWYQFPLYAHGVDILWICPPPTT